MRLLRLELTNWRNFAQVDVALHRRVFLVGPNAAGKSNLLDAVRFLRDLAREGGGLQVAVRSRGGLASLRHLNARRTPQVRLAAELGDTPDIPEWTYEIAFNQRRGSLRPVLEKERVTRHGEVLLDRPDKDDEGDTDRLTETHLEQISANREFRTIAEFLQTVTYLNIVPQIVRDPDRREEVIDFPHDPFGSDFLEKIARTSMKAQRSRLKRIETALQKAVPKLSELKLERDELGVPHLAARYENWRPRGAWQRETEFSDGTLRLIGLLWSLQDGTGPLLLEEPELSLNPAVVELVPQMIARIQGRMKSGRQVLLSTHSPDLLRDSGIAPEEVLLLLPGREATDVQAAATHPDVQSLYQAGESLADAVRPSLTPVGLGGLLKSV